ncbi:tRNA (adenosine(37)-N6)-dimethylallyltransferase MiaA [Scrofimicrobium sp. R131]|uniref:tRNA dimethylallyltransferase n=1 Tax=Scrofimicrobium appendicitidis TaxID=3079930 RepID=A0AAU7V6U2_9ACTO
MTGAQMIAVVGQTASGKTDLGLLLAERLGGTVVNADSMQLYRGLEIGTAKTPVDQRRGIPHLLFDVLEIEQEASVARYQQEARQAVSQLLAEGRTPIVVGGSGLYVRALLDRFEFPGTDPEVRSRLEERCQQEGPGALHAELSRVDPAAAAQIHPHNARRIIRALEVIELTGAPYSAQLPDGKYFFEPTVQVAIRWDYDQLDRRINERTREMFADGGIVEETRALLDSGRHFGKTAARATGYAQALAVLRSELTVPEAIEQVSLLTRQLARRQMKWFKRDERIRWLNPGQLPG